MDTRRLHISGLTPAITKDDLAHRLSTFGTVKTIDGIGLLDGVGRPRKFAYATLEATPAKLAKCMNTLSGSTWKGAKLRIGEAKPDYAGRIPVEDKQYQELAAKRAQRRLKRRWHMASHASDMSLVTPESAARKGAWVITPLGRVYRPMKMRPLRPLPPPSTSTTVVRRVLKEKGKAIKERKRVKKTDVRARRKKIDMTRWGSVHLKGRFLDTDLPLEVQRAITVDVGDGDGNDNTADDDDDDESDEHIAQEDHTEDEDLHTKPHIPTLHPSPIHPAQPSSTHPSSSLTTLLTNTSTEINTADVNPDLALEAQRSLDILASLFGNTGVNDDADDWVGRESLDSDIDEAEITRSQRTGALTGNAEDGGQFEVVPREDGRRVSTSDDVNEDVDMQDNDAHSPAALPTNIKASQTNNQSQAPAQPTKLKDLFASREEEGGFSLIDHLNLELELDEDVPFPTTHEETQFEHTVPIPDPAAPIVTHTTTTTANLPKKHEYASRIQIDPSQPLFFPLTLLSSHPHAKNVDISTNAKNRPKDLFDTLKARGWDWRSGEFYRTLTEDEVRERWDAQKGELTREWKKRCREAGRAGRGRKGREEADGFD